jgi:hypothetical protein
MSDEQYVLNPRKASVHLWAWMVQVEKRLAALEGDSSAPPLQPPVSLLGWMKQVVQRLLSLEQRRAVQP